MTTDQTLLAVLLESRGLGRYGSFAAAYQRAARSVDPPPGGAAPSRAQFHRWITCGLRGLPYTDHCRVLEHMLPGYSAAQLFQPCPDREIPPWAQPTGQPSPASAAASGMPSPATHLAGVDAVFASRSEFAACVQAESLQYQPGFLSSLTRLNIGILSRLRDRLPGAAHSRLKIAVYDETIRYNILIAGDQACVVQPYLPRARGVESPTLLIRSTGPGSLFPVFAQVWATLAERSKPL